MDGTIEGQILRHSPFPVPKGLLAAAHVAHATHEPHIVGVSATKQVINERLIMIRMDIHAKP